MRTLLLQVHPEKLRGISLREVEALLTVLARVPLVREHRREPGVGYVNWSFDTELPALIWASIRQDGLLDLIGRAVIVTCQGERGWDDYLLLHHSDEGEELDSLG